MSVLHVLLHGYTEVNVFLSITIGRTNKMVHDIIIETA